MTILLTMLLGATSYSGTYADGLQAYENQNYPQAIEAFESLVFNRVYEAEVFYNLGNAYYQAGNHPAAIVNYERALRIDPALHFAHDNVQQVVNLTQQQLARPQPTGIEDQLFFWHTRLSTTQSLSIAVICWLLFWGGLIVHAIRPIRYALRLSLMCGFVSLVFWASWMLKNNPMELAVVQWDSIPVRTGIKESDSKRFELFSGDRVQIDARKGEKVRIVLADGERGWMDEKYLIPVWPPERAPGM